MLALSLGMTVDEMLSRISSQELSEWQAYYEVQPWGDLRADHRHGILCAQVWAVGSQGQARPTPAEFVPNYLPLPVETPAQRMERQKLAFEMATLEMGGQVNRSTP